ncbi:nitrilase-related carbon-nitrogen hydrolase [Spirochaetia bacterium 38H-sp]|uniref:Nitrilase-related carbon-nitrogen hydrolase n=1 Tax=Rarispira pelagica TaxID=3141764 RepID=A0ABU9UCS9_9SPIR
MRVGYLQYCPEFLNPEENIKKIEQHIKSYKEKNPQDIDLLVLPELALSGYFFADKEEVIKIAENIDTGKNIKKLHEIAKKYRINIVTGFAEEEDGNFYNSAAMLRRDGGKEVYRKMHLFAEEKKFFTAGNLGFPVFQLEDIKIAMLVCYDHFFPEAARSVALQGAQIICHPSNLVLPEYGQITTWVRAVENHVFWILANRIGTEKQGERQLTYTGRSHIVKPDGTKLAVASETEEELMVYEINPEEAKNKTVTPYNDLFADRRTDSYIMFT